VGDASVLGTLVPKFMEVRIPSLILLEILVSDCHVSPLHGFFGNNWQELAGFGGATVHTGGGHVLLRFSDVTGWTATAEVLGRAVCAMVSDHDEGAIGSFLDYRASLEVRPAVTWVWIVEDGGCCPLAGVSKFGDCLEVITSEGDSLLLLVDTGADGGLLESGLSLNDVDWSRADESGVDRSRLGGDSSWCSVPVWSRDTCWALGDLSNSGGWTSGGISWTSWDEWDWSLNWSWSWDWRDLSCNDWCGSSSSLVELVAC